MNLDGFLGVLQYIDSLNLPNDISEKYHIIDSEHIKLTFHPRPQFAHKGTFGHGLLVAGHEGMAGAALLASRACMRSGIGKLTVVTQSSNRIILQLGIPEAILSIQDITPDNPHYSIDPIYDGIAIGPGIGTSSLMENAFLGLLDNHNGPMVIDADAITILSKHSSYFNHLHPLSILTPHKAEFARIVGSSDNDLDELVKAIDLAKECQIIIVLKGHFSKVVLPDGSVWFNTTGNSGMATAGSGDVLTGMLLSFIAQKYTPQEAACLAVFLHGLAGDCAYQNLGGHSLIASDIIQYIPVAFKQLVC